MKSIYNKTINMCTKYVMCIEFKAHYLFANKHISMFLQSFLQHKKHFSNNLAY